VRFLREIKNEKRIIGNVFPINEALNDKIISFKWQELANYSYRVKQFLALLLAAH
jgi:hypothetical protein